MQLRYHKDMGNDEQLAACAQRWPGVHVEHAAFESHLTALGWAERCPETLPELYLCFAAGQRNPTALQFFERAYTPHLVEGIRRIGNTAQLVDDTLQSIRERLFLAQPPKLWNYNGRGPLATWLRIVGSRAALDRVRASRAREYALDDFAQRLATEAHLDSQLDATHHASGVARCFCTAMASLAPRGRGLLRMHYAAGLSIDVIGKSYGVHRATAARWLTQAREDFADALRAELRSSLGKLADTEVARLVLNLGNRLDVLITSWHNVQAAAVEGAANPTDG